MNLVPISMVTERDRRVAIVGVVIESAENYLVLEDYTGRAKVYYDDSPSFPPKRIALVVGVAMSTAGEVKEVQADAVADITGIDLNLLKQTLKLRADAAALGYGRG